MIHRSPFARVLLDAAESLRGVYGSDFELAELWLLLENLRERGASLEHAPRDVKERLLRGMIDIYDTILEGDPGAPPFLYEKARKLRFWAASGDLDAALEEP